MQTIVRQRTQNGKPRQPSGLVASSPAKQPNRLAHRGNQLRPLRTQRRGEQGSTDI
jgi:hypothetical protein